VRVEEVMVRIVLVALLVTTVICVFIFDRADDEELKKYGIDLTKKDKSL